MINLFGSCRESVSVMSSLVFEEFTRMRCLSENYK
jgi:hypothetical protein